MKELIGKVELLNRMTGDFDPASVFREFDEKNIDDLEQLWRPMLVAQRTPDSHWKWAEKARAVVKLLQYETFAIECDGRTQGLMIVNLMKFAQIVEQIGRDLVYIELLATAPWNRPKVEASPRYKGVGRILIGTAISLSHNMGFNGRIALHSLTDSENWYRDEAGFTDLGFDNKKMMRYFEMTEAQATAFLRAK